MSFGHAIADFKSYVLHWLPPRIALALRNYRVDVTGGRPIGSRKHHA